MPNIWHAYHIENCPQSKPPKDKFVAIVCKDSKLMGFFINSNIRPYVQKKPDLFACQAVIEASNHKFLKYDSYVDCSNLIEFEDAQLVNECEPISKQAMALIKEAVDNSKTIEVRYKKLILGKI